MVAIFLAGLLSALVGLIIKPLAKANETPGYVFIAVGGLCLLAGIAVAWRVTRQYYELRLANVEAGGSTEARLDRLEEREQQLASSITLLDRVGTYTEHVYTLMEVVGREGGPLADLAGAKVAQVICALAEGCFRRATDANVLVSIWGEPDSVGVGDRISRTVGQRVSDPVSELLPGGPRFEILNAPHHPDEEREAFAEIHVENSWLKYNQKDEEHPSDAQEQEEPRERADKKRRVYRADAPYSALRGEDIRAFSAARYKSVCAVSFERDGAVGYLVALSKTPSAFGELEERYLLWLRRVIHLDGSLGHPSKAE